MILTYAIAVLAWMGLMGGSILAHYKGDKPWMSWTVMGIGEVLAFITLIRLNC